MVGRDGVALFKRGDSRQDYHPADAQGFRLRENGAEG